MTKGRNAVEGRIYTIRSKTECQEEGITFPDIPKVVRGHMVLVLDRAAGNRYHARVMTITSTLHEGVNYLPISPTRKKGYDIQLRLCNDGDRIVTLPKPRDSYLRIDAEYEVPLSILREAVDFYGFPYMLWFKRHGGVRHLREFLRQRDSRNAAHTMQTVLATVGNVEETESAVTSSPVQQDTKDSHVCEIPSVEPSNSEEPVLPSSSLFWILVSSCVILVPLLLFVKEWRKW